MPATHDGPGHETHTVDGRTYNWAYGISHPGLLTETPLHRLDEPAVAVNQSGIMQWEPGAAEFVDDQLALFEQQGVNYALWLWKTSWEPYAEEVDAFNFRHGPDPLNHSAIASSRLMQILRTYWALNVIRPSTPKDSP